MRSEPCWTSYPFQVAISWIAAFLVTAGVVLLAECSPAPAHAETGPYLNLSAGVSIGQHTSPDGIWYQQGLNYNVGTHALAWKAGAGWQWDRIGLEVNYVNLGTRRVVSEFVGDEVYDVKQHRCIGTPVECANIKSLTASDAMHGGEVLFSYRWHAGDWTPYVKFGGAWILNRFTIETHAQYFAQKLYGGMPMAVGGIGLAYKWAYIEADYYSLVGKPPESTPMSTQVILTTFGMHIPIGG